MRSSASEDPAMKAATLDILISGASVAGPTLAYWLSRSGFTPIVVERTPALRAGLGGHAVDLLGPAVDVAERMGILPAVLAAGTGTDVISIERPGRSPVLVDVGRAVAGIASRHVEIMRGELTSILYEATRDDAEYVFGDSIRTLDQDDGRIALTFEHGSPRTVDLVVGADGLHSNVRRLTFGDQSRFRHYLGGYLGVFTLPNHLRLDGRMVMYNAPGRMVAMYPVRQTGAARALFLFRQPDELAYDHRDTGQQKRLLRQAFAADGWEVPRMLAQLDGSPDLYFDSISQIRMETWSRGRVTLVGDAGYCPAPAVGGGTAVAVGAYVLAGELRAAGGDHTTAFARYEQQVERLVAGTRALAPTMMKTLIPRTRRQVWVTTQLMRVLPRRPAPVQRGLSSFVRAPARALRSVDLSRYEPAAAACEKPTAG
jgi:2-polyprenyl-6-methoxyphenol hydroxylase-like FAD-dependent oxidoreductase